jgi:hypothetical protein
MILMVLWEITRVLMLVQTIVVPLLLPRNAGTKARMVEYLNATVKMLIKRQLDSKKSICN